MRTRAAAFIVAMAVVGALLPMPGAGADNHTTYEVQAGAFLNGKGPRQVSMRFFPSTIKVERGDVLHFSAQGTHTATVLPVGVSPDAWMSAYSGGPDLPWSVYLNDPDEGAAARKLNLKAGLVPSDCGGEATPCLFTGGDAGNPEDSVLHSGIPLDAPLDFSVLVDVEAPSSFWVVDLVNDSMRLKVNVVATGASTQNAINKQKNKLIANDATAAKELHSEYATKRSKTVKKSGLVIWKAWAGLDKGTVALRYMYPTKLTLNKGQAVKWNFSQLAHQGHSVTLPATIAAEVGAAVPEIQCDPDGDEGTAPDEARQEGLFPYCYNPFHLELDLPELFTSSAGDGVYKAGAEIESSGFRGGPLSESSKPYQLKFPSKSPKSGFKYSSVSHPFMLGTVVVK